MSEAVLRAALLGTGRQGAPAADAHLEALLPQAALGDERRLLLLAGIDAVRRRAGYRAAVRAEAPPSAPNETKPVCSKVVGEVISDLLEARNDALLTEAAHLLLRAGQRLRPELLPAALSGVSPPELREAFLPILGERGAWLARFRSEWSWAAPVAAGPDAANAKEIWTEGTFYQRLQVIRRLRANDPAAARALLESSWKEETAEHRAALIGAMASGLSAADEPLLESVLDDRSVQVRAAAAPLLARIEGSAFAARMERRIDALLGSSLPLRVSLPRDLDASWQRDGVPRNAPKGVGAKAFWLARTIALVRPSHLERRFSASPAKIVAAALRTEESAAFLQGLTEATLLFHEPAWAAALFDALIARKADDSKPRDPLIELLGEMDPSEVEARALEFLARPSERIDIDDALSALRAPWTPAFSLRVVDAVRRTIADPDVRALGVAAQAVAPEAIPHLASLLARPGSEPVSPRDEMELDWAREILRVRRILHEQITSAGRSTR